MSPCPDCPADLLTAVVVDTWTGESGLVLTVVHENTCPNYGTGDPAHAGWLDNLVDEVNQP